MSDTDVPLSARRLVITPPEDAAVDVRRDLEVPGADGAPIAVDVYRPGGAAAAVPAVIIAVGYPGGTAPGAFKALAFVRDWATWFAASGLAAITYANRAPHDDLTALLRHVERHAFSWGVDGKRLGLFAQSGNVPVALAALMRDRHAGLRCAAFTYGFMIDAGGRTAVADAAKAFGFANPCAGVTLDDVDPTVPMLIVRAGQDQFSGLNGSIDDFVAGALARNYPVSLINLPTAPHGFDLADNSPASWGAIRDVIAFVCSHLTA